MTELDLELFGDSFDDVPSPIQYPGGLQDTRNVTRSEQPGGSQQMGWPSPTDSPFAESLHGVASDEASPTRNAAEDYPAEPSKEDMVAELARLKAMVAAMSDRLGQTETSSAPETPPTAQPVRPQTAPRKRTASRVADFAASPSKRQQSVVPSQVSNSAGPIEAMWSPGVTPEQRRAIYDNKMHFAGPPPVAMSPPSFTTPNQTSSPAAISNASSTPTRKPATRKPRTSAPKKAPAPKKSPVARKTPAPKKSTKAQAQAQHQRTQSTPSLPTFTGNGLEALQFLTPQAPRPGDRPISELYKANFMTLDIAEKARLLLPLLEGNDPATGKKWAEPGSLGRELLASSPPNAFFCGSDPFTSSSQLSAPNASSSASAMVPMMSLPPAPAKTPVEKTGVQAYPEFNTWYAALKNAPIIQTAAQPASSDGNSNNNLSSQSPSSGQTSSNEASILTPSVIKPLMSYVQDGTSNEQISAHPQDINAPSNDKEPMGNLLQHFNSQNTINNQVAFGNTESPEFEISEFFDDDAFTSVTFALNSDASAPKEPFSFTATEATSDDLFGSLITGDLSENIFAGMDTTGDNTFPPFNNQDNPFTFCNVDNASTDMFTANDNFSLFDSSPDLNHMLQQATAQIQAPDSGAMRQREALVQHERRVSEGRRR
jgi:hypothetical protein